MKYICTSEALPHLDPFPYAFTKEWLGYRRICFHCDASVVARRVSEKVVCESCGFRHFKVSELLSSLKKVHHTRKIIN